MTTARGKKERPDKKGGPRVKNLKRDGRDIVGGELRKIHQEKKLNSRGGHDIQLRGKICGKKRRTNLIEKKRRRAVYIERQRGVQVS